MHAWRYRVGDACDAGRLGAVSYSVQRLCHRMQRRRGGGRCGIELPTAVTAMTWARIHPVMLAIWRLLYVVGMACFFVPLASAKISGRQLTTRERYVAMFGLVATVIGFLLSGGHFRGPPRP
jgi:hypothetical protein